MVRNRPLTNLDRVVQSMWKNLEGLGTSLTQNGNSRKTIYGKMQQPFVQRNNYTFKPYELVLEIESSCWIKMKQVVQRFVLFWFNLSVNVSLQLVDEVCDDVHVA